jgi:murein DD-endopeptidase MepM/ murein hydrolase activator NlpD
MKQIKIKRYIRKAKRIYAPARIATLSVAGRRFEAKKSLRLAVAFTHKNIMIRPRLRLVSQFLLIAFLALIPLSQASKAIALNKDKVVVNGHKILVAQAADTPNNTDEVNNVDQTIEAKKSPFEYHMPVNGYISQGFSWYHNGVDIAADLGSPIHALGEGKVIFAGFLAEGHGNTVIIEHDNGLQSLYAHMDKIYVGSGDQIDTQRPIGAIGLTGRTTGPHVHMEVIDNGIHVDPAGLLPVTQ